MFKSRKVQENLIKGFHILSQSMILFQILFVVLVLLISLHLLMLLVGKAGLSFITKFTPTLKSVITTLFGHNIQSSQPEIDGELVLFVFLCIFCVYLCFQVKEVCKRLGESLANAFEKERLEYEDKFNAELQKDLRQNTLRMNNTVYAIQLKIKSIITDPVKASLMTPEKMLEIKQQVLSDYFDMVKNIKNVTFSKDKDVLLIYSTDFDLADTILGTIQDSLAELTKKYRQEKILVKAKIAVNTGMYETPRVTLYKEIQPLFALNYPGQILCFGNVRGRYSVSMNKQYELNINGKYDIDGRTETVWAFIKKN